MSNILPYIPEYITVHLGPPDSDARNVTVPFVDYVKNVASSEIYPTWPENAIRANMYAQISYALNRIYTEYYRSRGYDFDITSSTAYDQAFVDGRDYFDTISKVADELFADYIYRQGSVEPLFAQYCNGTTVTCAGLSQWGTVDLADRGYTPYRILQYYYGEDININTDTPVRGLTASLPPRPLQSGSSSNDVVTLQTRLNRISQNYPSIPKIYPVNGLFTSSTEDAVREFQRIFNLTQDGIVGPATWYAVQRIYAAVKRLTELDSEGVALGEISRQYPEVLREGDSGEYVKVVQYLLAYVAQYVNAVPPIPVTGYYGPQTAEAVRAFQREYGLTADGVMGELTYGVLFDVYRGLIASQPDSLFAGRARPYPGVPLALGSEGEYVGDLQEYLGTIAGVYDGITAPDVTGFYGSQTQNAVEQFQQLYGLTVSGVVRPDTWNAIASAYDDILAGESTQAGQYPGYVIS